MNNIAILSKFSDLSSVWSNLKRSNKSKGMNVEIVVDKFNGFEGELISLFPFDKATNYLDDFQEMLSEQRLILYVKSDTNKIDSFIEDNFAFAGFDFGICEKDATNYSSIFNEVLFGIVPELIQYQDRLNENLLFQEKALANEYALQHNQLLKLGKDVEHEDYMNIFEIWKFKK